MRVVFMGTPEFAIPTLQHLVHSEFSVIGVVCQPDRPSGRGKKVQFGPVKTFALAQNLSVVQPEKMKDPSFLETLRSWNPDVIVVAAYGRILPQVILDLPPKGCLNVHGSLLPKYRGAAPIQWAVINGEPETGVTIIVMDAGMDTGAILEQAVVPISAEDTAGDVAVRMAEMGGKWFPLFRNGRKGR
jgi:methionyl-tRNA formyltransferase